MNEEEMAAYEATQAEMRELGLKDDSVEESPVVETKEEVDDTTEQVPVKEVEQEVKPRVEPDVYKEIKQNLREELQKDFDEKLEKIKSEYTEKEPQDTTSLEEEAKALAQELNFDEAKTLALLKSARKGVELSPEDKQALEDFKAMKAEREQEALYKAFDNEWDSLDISKQFPNATEEQLEAAREKMGELVDNDKYADKDMDYIMFKEKEAFNQILFSPRQKTFEPGKVRPDTFQTEDEWPEIRPDMSPAQIESLERKRERMLSDTPREKMLLRTTDDAGRVVERWV